MSESPAAGGEGSGPVVLVVEDERDLADIYSGWLDDRYDVRTAYSGRDGLNAFDEDVDVALLDRRIPNMSGDRVLERIRASDVTVGVSVITAVEPDFDIVDMEFDDYLVKPVFKDDLVETVERLRDVVSYDRDVRRYYSLVSKRAMLEVHKSRKELAASDTYEALTDEILACRDQLDRDATQMEREDFDAAFARL
jgi:DNA-binding response OmpR family regulator